MLAALRIALARNLVGPDQAERIEQTIQAYGPLPSFRSTPAKLLEVAGRDKKNSAGTRRFILPKGIGNAVVVEDVTEAELNSAIAWLLSTARK
jgi:3-dehydroquinate synthase